jgi:hypothetical protein
MNCLVDLGMSVREAGSSSRIRKADFSFEGQNYNAFRDHLRIVLQSYHAYEAERSDQLETKHAVNDLLSLELRPEQDHMIEANLRRRHRSAWASYRANKIKASNVVHQYNTQKHSEPAVVPSGDTKGIIDLPVGTNNAEVVRHSQTGESVSTVKTTVLQSALKSRIPDSAPTATPRSRPSTRNTKITAEIVHPQPPRVALSGAYQTFQCPYCRDTLSSDIARSRSSWK